MPTNEFSSGEDICSAGFTSIYLLLLLFPSLVTTIWLLISVGFNQNESLTRKSSVYTPKVHSNFYLHCKLFRQCHSLFMLGTWSH